MIKKFASFTLFMLFTSPLILTFFLPLSEDKASAVHFSAPVAQTGRDLPIEPLVQHVDPTSILPTSQPTIQSIQAIPVVTTLQPTEILIPIAEQGSGQEKSEEFKQFIAEVVDGTPGVLRGVYVENVLALPVIQQPKNDELFVSNERGVATQFQNAANYGIIGLLAHNYLSGELFYKLAAGQPVQLVYGDGKVDRYIISASHRFKKLEPYNPRSRFIDLSTGKEKSTDQVFNRFYTGKEHLVFQTCIKKGEVWSWGLIFFTAYPVE